MAKVFTITEGVENLGALKTGGQGSVYKGKRQADIFTAIKILPTPVFSESAEDKNYRSFRNEVEKLIRVNESPNPNVVKIHRAGITDTGNFPFIEMEFIEGPDLGELLNSPHPAIFTLTETIRVAEHLSNALAHCHKYDVLHGDIKSNNVKFNQHTGNYVLLDFGLSLLPDEERRTSLRNAGAIEFMAPEQIEGEMFFETDIYSFGIIIFELLAGLVPFPLSGHGEKARMDVVKGHLESSIPGIQELRKQHLPASWTDEEKVSEMEIPLWLTVMVNKCLEKKPADRFKNGMELKQFISKNIIGTKQNAQAVSLPVLHPVANKNPSNEQGEITGNKPNGIQISMPVFIFLVGIFAFLLAYSTYTFFSTGKKETASTSSDNKTVNDSGDNSLIAIEKTVPVKPLIKDSIPEAGIETDKVSEEKPKEEVKKDTVKNEQTPDKPKTNVAGIGKKYRIDGIAYLYDRPEAISRSGAFITSASRALLEALNDQDGFVLVEFKSQNGEMKRSWLNKKDLRLVEE